MKHTTIFASHCYTHRNHTRPLLAVVSVATVRAVTMAAMANLATGVVPHLTPFFCSTKCATAAASSCLTACALA
jgi:hypothetical protein